jgi:glycosyltransferase involved in cell wall biosynthesis
MQENPKISVLMSVYNADLSMLTEAVNSILLQSYRNFEFIIIDDINSNDVSTYLYSLNRLDPRIYLMKNEKNLGLTKSLCKAANIATGVFLARQDADDISSPIRFHRQIKMFIENPSLVLTGTWYSAKLLSGEVRPYSPIDDDMEFKRNLFYRNPICHASAMFKKNAYESVSGYDLRFTTCQDLDLWFRISKIGRVGFVTEDLVLRRISINSISQSSKAYLQVLNSFIIRWRERKHYPGDGATVIIVVVTIKHFLITMILSLHKTLNIFKY